MNVEVIFEVVYFCIPKIRWVPIIYEYTYNILMQISFFSKSFSKNKYYIHLIKLVKNK